MVASFAFAFGLVVGSFLNVVVYRVPRGQSVVFPSSRCPSCGHALAALDNVPLVSWLALRSRCRYCGVAISARYPLIETMCAALFAAAALKATSGLELVASCAFGAALIAILFIDLDHLLIPDSMNWVVGGVGLASAILLRSVPAALEGGVVGLAIFGAVYLATRGAGMGLGDVKLASAAGLFLGFPASVASCVASFVIGTLVTAPALLAGRRGRRDAIPFGPFIVLAALLTQYSPALVYGPYEAYRTLLNAHFLTR